VFLPIPGIIFDFFSFNFHVPMCGLAANDAVPVARQTARVTNSVFDFMAQMKTGIGIYVNAFLDLSGLARAAQLNVLLNMIANAIISERIQMPAAH